MLILALFLGCTSAGVVLDGGTGGSGGGEVGGGDDGGGDDGDSVDDTGEGASDDTGEGSSALDCSAVEGVPLDSEKVPGARGFHGLAFDSEGWLVGSDGSSLIRADSTGEWEVWIPGVGEIEQLAFLPDGDLIVASRVTGDINRYTPSGGSTRIASSVWSYAVLVGPDDLVYLTSGKDVLRMDPDTGEAEVLATLTGGAPPHSLQFDKHHTKLFVGTAAETWGHSEVYSVPLDESLQPTGDPEVFAEGVGHGWHDGIAVDACENVYVAEFGYRSLYRITPDGQEVRIYKQWASSGSYYSHGLTWGTGEHGWPADALFVPMPYASNQVMVHTTGVPGSDWEGEVLLEEF